MTPLQPQTILNLVGEGGGYAIESMQSPDGCFFRLNSSGMEWDHDTDEECWSTRHGDWHSSIDKVFTELNPSWYLLYPRAVHADFGPTIWQHFISAARKAEDDPPRSVRRWSEVLLARRFNTLEEANGSFAPG